MSKVGVWFAGLHDHKWVDRYQVGPARYRFPLTRAWTPLRLSPESASRLQIMYFWHGKWSRRKIAANSLNRFTGFELVRRTSSFKDEEENRDWEAIRFSACWISPIVTVSWDRGPLSVADKTRWTTEAKSGPSGFLQLLEFLHASLAQTMSASGDGLEMR
jgi:hypothetical protein